jgi:hypothetical protein
MEYLEISHSKSTSATVMKRILQYLVSIIVILTVGGAVSYCFYLRSDNPSEKEHNTVVKEGVVYFGQGRLEYRKNIPFLYVKGDSYEIGLQYGVLLKEDMISFYARVDSLENAMMDRLYSESPWYRDIIIWISTPFVVRNRLNSFKERVSKDYLSQLQGMSDGSGIPLDNILFVTFGPSWLSCSSFIKKVGGSFIHGRNADHDEIEFFSRYPLVAHYDRVGKYSYIDIGIIGTPFAVTGVNEHGLTLSWSQATSATSRPFDGNGTMMMFNRILEECRNLNDVDKTDKNVERFVAMIGSMEDRTGAAYDIVDQQSVRTDLRDGYIYATNRCVSEPVRKEYNSVFEMDWYNSARAYTYQKILSNDAAFTVDDAIDLLSNTDFYDYTGKVPPYEGGNINNRGTGSSVVCDPQNSTVYFAYGAPYAGFSRWIAYNYETDEVSIYRNKNERLNDPEVVKYCELEKRWRDVDWNNKDELRQMAREIEQASVENFWTLHMSCWAWNALGEPAKAEAIIKRQIEKYPDMQTGYANMGFLYVYQGELEKAIKYYRKALDASITNDRKRLYCNEQLAAAYAEIGDEITSLKFYRKALNIYNSYWIPEKSREKVHRMEELLRNKD